MSGRAYPECDSGHNAVVQKSKVWKGRVLEETTALEGSLGNEARMRLICLDSSHLPAFFGLVLCL